MELVFPELAVVNYQETAFFLLFLSLCIHFSLTSCMIATFFPASATGRTTKLGWLGLSVATDVWLRPIAV